MSSRSPLLAVLVGLCGSVVSCTPVLETPMFRDAARIDVVTPDARSIDAVSEQADRDGFAADGDSARVDAADDEAPDLDVISTVDVVTPEAGRADAGPPEGGTCGPSTTPYACPDPTSCGDLQTALQAAYQAAKAESCCVDSDCSLIVSGDLCCPEEDVVVGTGPAADCVRTLIGLASHFSPCPAACTARACAIVVRGACIAGQCRPNGG